jgi:hypothetical protein
VPVLFAFDGTNQNFDANSNVAKFSQAYPGEKFYMPGPGVRDPASGIENPSIYGGPIADMALAITGQERVGAMVENLNDYSNRVPDKVQVNVDIVGYSRGAVLASDFAHKVTEDTDGNGVYHYTSQAPDGTTVEHQQKVNLRFMGLFDRVLSTHTGSYDLSISPEIDLVAQAVALNEHRQLFPLESISDLEPAPGQKIIERGFIGSHSDIGGDTPLGAIPLVWMASEAATAGVELDPKLLPHTVNAELEIHDQSINPEVYKWDADRPIAEEREVRFATQEDQPQREAEIDGMTYADTKANPFIDYTENLSFDHPPNEPVGTVDARAYLQWLNEHEQGYNIDLQVQP